MAKKSEIKKNEYNHEVCNYKHEEIKEQFKTVNDSIKEVTKDNMKTKEKMILNDAKIGEKLDVLITKTVNIEKMENKIDDINNYIKTIRGNGEPSITEHVRTLKRWIKWMFYGIIIMFAFIIGGDVYNGISRKSLSEYIMNKLLHRSSTVETTTPHNEISNDEKEDPNN